MSINYIKCVPSLITVCKLVDIVIFYIQERQKIKLVYKIYIYMII